MGADLRIRPFEDMEGDPQHQLVAHADSNPALPLQNLAAFVRRDYKVFFRSGAGGSENNVLHDVSNQGMPGQVVLAAAGNADFRVQVCDVQGRPLVGTAGLSATEQADGREINPRIMIIVPPDFTLTAEAGAPASQTLRRLNGAVLPRAGMEMGYLGTCGLGLNENGIDMSAVRGFLHLNIARVAGSTGTQVLQFYVLESPTKVLGYAELRLAAA